MTGAEKLEDLPSAFLLHLLGADKGGGCTTHTYRGKRMEAAALTSQRMGERSPRGGGRGPPCSSCKARAIATGCHVV